MANKLNLGCGTDIRPGWINLDIAPLEGVDIVHDINKLPLPFKSDSFEYILCKDILEHVDYAPLMKELHRILKKGGIIEIEVPHFTSRLNFVDPTHKKLFSYKLFEFFLENHPRSYYFDFHFSEIIFTRITFEKSLLFYNYLVEPLVNINEKTMRLYEATFLSRLFPAGNLIVKLRK